MRDDLYRDAILAEAAKSVGEGVLDHADARATVHNPLCGDRVTIEAQIEGDKIAAIAHQVRGCVLCRAAASIIGAAAPGAHIADTVSVREDLAAMLLGEGKVPTGRWQELGIFEAAAAYKYRHRCVTLPFEALSSAIGSLDRNRQI